MSDHEHALTDDERRWIRSLERLAAKCPPTLGLWGDGTLAVVALTEDGALMHPGEVICMVTGVAITAGGGDPDWINVEDIDRPWVNKATPPRFSAKNEEDS